ncbi:MAG: DUF1566 domain-containing protein [Bacteroidales bacterium]|nr:DUF1566 domain-containing protein [Bacteroidales bacterium]
MIRLTDRCAFVSIILLGTLAVIASGCIKEDIGKKGDDTGIVDLPLSIAATAPQRPDAAVGSAPVKTMTPDGTKVYWEDGDQIALFPGAETEAERYRKVLYTASFDGDPRPNAKFYRSQFLSPYKENLGFLAAYPASSVDRWGSNERLTCYVILPAQQTARLGGWDPAAGILAASSMTPEFHFDHAVGYVKFVVDGSTTPFVSVEVAYPDISTVSASDAAYFPASVSDQVVIRYQENTIDVIQYEKAANVMLNDYTLDHYPSSKAVLNTPDSQPFAQGDYYVAVMPRVYPDGLSLVFKSSEGNVAVTRVEGPIDLSAGKVMNVGPVGELTFRTPIQNHTVWSDADGENQGVVFWVDEANPIRAKIVSICDHQHKKWASTAEYFGVEDSDPLVNYESTVGRADFSSEKFPAVAYCKSLRESSGGEWRLPTIEEMKILYNSYYSRTYISPLRGDYNYTDEQENPLSISGFDYREQHDLTKKEYQTVLSSKKNFDAMLEAIGEPAPASLDGVQVIGTSGSYSVDQATYEDGYGTAKGVTYWLHKETRLEGSTGGKNAYMTRIGSYTYANVSKTQGSVYARCIKEVTLQ